MTMPASNINLIADVRNGFMQDSSGNASLNSQQYRDGARKATGNIALTDFANTAWAAGRDLYREDEWTAFRCKPYSRAAGVDNAIYSNSDFTMTDRSGLPGWRTRRYGGQSYPMAGYNNSFFYCARPGIDHKLDLRVVDYQWVNTQSYVDHQIKIIGWESGYKNGLSETLMDWTSMGASATRSYTFRPKASRPWVQISMRAYCAATGGLQGSSQVIEVEAYDMRCYV